MTVSSGSAADFRALVSMTRRAAASGISRKSCKTTFDILDYRKISFSQRKSWEKLALFKIKLYLCRRKTIQTEK